MCGELHTINPKTGQTQPRAVYVLVHELAHLIEPHHGSEFSRLLDRSLPDWRQRQEELHVKAAAIYWCGANMGQ